MLERIYKYRITCDGVTESKRCQNTAEYETSQKDSIPSGWHADECHGYEGRRVDYYCKTCWRETCVYMANHGSSTYGYLLQQLNEIEDQS